MKNAKSDAATDQLHQPPDESPETPRHPALGDRVWFTVPRRVNGDVRLRTHLAMIVNVKDSAISPAMVDLQVFFRDGRTGFVSDVHFSPGQSGSCWTWPDPATPPFDGSENRSRRWT